MSKAKVKETKPASPESGFFIAGDQLCASCVFFTNPGGGHGYCARFWPAAFTEKGIACDQHDDSIRLTGWKYDPILKQFECEVVEEGVSVRVTLYNRGDGNGHYEWFMMAYVAGSPVAGPTRMNGNQIRYGAMVLLDGWYAKVRKAIRAKGHL